MIDQCALNNLLPKLDCMILGYRVVLVTFIASNNIPIFIWQALKCRTRKGYYTFHNLVEQTCMGTFHNTEKMNNS